MSIAIHAHSIHWSTPGIRALGVGLVSLVLIALAFQVPYAYHIDVGAVQDRQYVVNGLYFPEQFEGRTFRWTKKRASIQIPALAGGEWKIILTVDAWQPDAPAPLTVRVNGQDKITFEGVGRWQKIETVHDASSSSGELRLELLTSGFRPSETLGGSTDSRRLGVKWDRVDIEPVGAGLRMPPLLGQVIPLSLTLYLVYLMLARLGYGGSFTALVTTAILVVFIALVALYRTYLSAQIAFVLLGTTLTAVMFVFWGLPLLRLTYSRGGVPVSPVGLGALALILVAAFLLKCVGIFSPQIYIVDALFHLHRLEFVEAGNLFFVTQSREFGGMQSIYPPALYIILSPLARLVPDQMILLKVFPLVLHVLGGFALFYLGRKNGLSERAAIFAVLFYAFVPITFLVFSWGVFANIFGVELLLLTLAIWFALPWDKRPAASSGILSFLLSVNMLAHPSMVPTLLVYWFAFLIAVAVWLPERRRRVVWSAGAFVTAAVFAFLLYYSYFFDKTIADLVLMQQRSGSATGGFIRVVGAALVSPEIGLIPVRVTTIGDWMVQSVIYLGREAWAYYYGVPVLLALVGLVLMARSESMRPLALCLGAGFVTVLVFFLVGMGVNLYTRYMLVALPLVSLGAGIACAALWQAGAFGRILTGIGIFVLVVQSIFFWIGRVLWV
jgi:hypothetical protein